MNDRNKIQDSVHSMALGGMMAALAVVIMCLGGLIPLATFACPVICMVILQFVTRLCSRRVGWAWYGAVALLSLLMGPDKEAASVFLFFGFYPLIKPKIDSCRLRWLWKMLLFNGDVLLMYSLLIHLFGMAELAAEFHEMGLVLLILTLILGNVTFLLVDKILGRKMGKR